MDEIIELDIHIMTLVIAVLIHSIFSISSIIFIIVTSLGKTYPILDVIVTITVLSFLIFNRCVAIDIYEYIRCDREDLPTMAKDDLGKNILKHFIKMKKPEKKKVKKSLRLDILQNITPIIDTNDEKDTRKFISKKFHYVIMNIILTVILLIKYKKEKFLPLLIPWMLFNFPLN